MFLFLSLSLSLFSPILEIAEYIDDYEDYYDGSKVNVNQLSQIRIFSFLYFCPYQL